jgi:superfamily I DNA/RNA helicase/mRNA-degrading endonuclease RelE of RelBE toxin-antitoxin system
LSGNNFLNTHNELIMSWTITQKPTFLSDFIQLNREQQAAIAETLRELEKDPISPRGDTVKRLVGYVNLYRYRLGDYRLIYAAELKARMINLVAVGPRSSVYKRFNFPGWDTPDTAVEFGPQLASLPQWTEHPEWFGHPVEAALPRQLTAELLTRWRVDPRYHDSLIACRTENDLLAANDCVPDAELERVMKGLYSPGAAELAAEPDHVLFDPEDLTRYAEGTLTGFLLRLDEQQEPLTRWALSGPTLVKGGPGSGKSTVALYRLRAVVERGLQTTGRIPSVLFATYTNALTHFSESLLCQLVGDLVPLTRAGKLPKEIRISTLHKTATMIAKQSGQTYEIVKSAQQLEALHAVRASFRSVQLGDMAKLHVHAATHELRDDYLLEEFEWTIEGQNYRDEADYLAADRTGRGMALGRERRAAVWQLYTGYRDYLLTRDLYTWGRLVQVALDRVRSGEYSRRWDHVIVDEAQDLAPAALALAVELCANPTGVFLTADANQSLYNRGFRWRNVHDSLRVAGRTRTLRRNYRSTRQIAAAAAEIMNGQSGEQRLVTAEMADASADGETLAQEYVHSGPLPLLYAALGPTDQWRWIAQQIVVAARNLRLPAGAAAVLVPSSEVGQPLAEALHDHGVPARFMNSHEFDLDEPGVKVTTLHAAKGLEFPIVVVAHVEAGRLPRSTEATDPDERVAYEEAQRRLLYVGCTRAMRRLYVTTDPALTSPFQSWLSEARW